MSLRRFVAAFLICVGLAFSATYGMENTSNVPAGFLTNYLVNITVPISGAIKNLYFPQGSPTTFAFNRATIVSNLCVGVYSASTIGTAGPMTFEVFTGTGVGTATGITFTLATSTVSGSYCDTTHTATVAAGIPIFVKWTGNGSTNTAGPVTSMYLRFQ